MHFTKRRLLRSTAAALGLALNGFPSIGNAQALDEVDGDVTDIPPVGQSVHWLRGQDIVLLSRLTPARRDELIALSPPGVDTALNTDGPARPATPDTLLHGPDQDILALSLFCTYLPCVVLQDYGTLAPPGGFYCVCHGSFFDGLGRIVSGPAERNLYAPTVQLLPGNQIQHLGRTSLG